MNQPREICLRDAPFLEIQKFGAIRASTTAGKPCEVFVLSINGTDPFLSINSISTDLKEPSAFKEAVNLEPTVTRALIAALTKTLESRPAQVNQDSPLKGGQSRPPLHPEGFFDPLEMSTHALELAVQAARVDSLMWSGSLQADLQAWLEIAELELEGRTDKSQ